MSMIVAIGTFEMHFPQTHSLKGKRQVLRCLIDRVKAKFNASIAEVDNNDLWQRGTIGVSMVANDRILLQKMAARIEEILTDHDQVEIVDYYWDYV
ncbi:MAG: uncharacterized protein PWR01_2759 [Clostridiales bacterium]|jgi:uncharacterized protein YlxP (DUF503 family)|nr:uncharacterized protein [Clostridiales bacterium]MDN5281686.1 uncharacterized protein [Candidatus Ozemobacter sp.]